MQSSSNADAVSSRENVYLVFRVFDLGKDTMGFRIYIDPEKHRRKGTLGFSSEKWTVAPGLAFPTSPVVT